MGLFDKNVGDAEQAVEREVKKEKKISAMQLLENDVMILERLELLQQKVDGMDRSNKKFLMAATMNDGRVAQLEQELLNTKKGVITLLDQVDVLQEMVFVSATEDLKKGLAVYQSKIAEVVAGLGLEEIAVYQGMPFESKEQECVEVVHLEEFEDDTVVALLQRGYRDRDSGNILRCAKVSVNKR